MPESTLSVTFADLKTEVANFLGYGTDTTLWSAGKLAEIERYCQSGYRQFLYPPPLEGQAAGHTWTFLKPVVSFDTVANQATYNLEDDFGGLIGEITYPDANTGSAGVIQKVGEGRIRAAQQGTASGYVGRPIYAAVIPRRDTGGVSGQRFDLVLWPTPDATYTLTRQINRIPHKLSDAAPYPLGGMVHSETLIQSCLDVAERRGNDEQGNHTAAFLKELARSITHDRSVALPEYFGYNADRSDAENYDPRRNRATGFVTLNGADF